MLIVRAVSRMFDLIVIEQSCVFGDSESSGRMFDWAFNPIQFVSINMDEMTTGF